MNEKMIDQIKIKQLTKEEANDSTAMALWKVAESGFNDDSGWTVKQIFQTLEAPNAIVLVASLTEDKQEKNVGLLIASKTLVESDIYMVVVREEYKQRGIGQQLFHALVEICTEQGLETIFLEVRESNTPAFKLYQSLGFEEIGRRRGYYSGPIEDALMMKLDL